MSGITIRSRAAAVCWPLLRSAFEDETCVVHSYTAVGCDTVVVVVVVVVVFEVVVPF